MAAASERAGRDPAGVTLMAVTKKVGLPEVRILHGEGVEHFGENRLPDCLDKVGQLDPPVQWHFIGNIQRRKAKDVAAHFDVADALDRIEVMEALNQRCEQAGRVMPIFIEVNISGEASKHGFEPSDAQAAVDRAREFSHLEPRGLLTMAPFVDDPEETRPVFARLRELNEACGLPELSMGMTNDFEVAIEEGATLVRIGSALFAE